MSSYFTADFFKGNRDRLRELLAEKAPVVITSNSLLQRNSDMAHPFRQDSNFWYLTGITEPELILVIDDDQEYIIAPERNQVRTIFDGGLDTRGIAERSGIRDVTDPKSGWKRLNASLRKTRQVATVAAPPAFSEHFEFYTNPARANLTAKLKSQNPDLELLDLRDHLAGMRMIKQPEELAAIKDSVKLTCQTLKKLTAKLSKMSYEYEVEAFITHSFRKAGAVHGYAPIIAGGPNACTLHYVANGDQLHKNDLLLIDTGAEKEYYAADITRTYALGEPSKRQLAVTVAVAEVQDFALGQLKPGLEMKSYGQAVERFMGEKLRELGLIEVPDSESVRKYFPHSVSHFLGLDVHDAGDYGRPLEAGVVLTVEPGIYIPEEGIGVRIEDDVLITKSGAKVLSGGLPRTLA